MTSSEPYAQSSDYEPWEQASIEAEYTNHRGQNRPSLLEPVPGLSAGRTFWVELVGVLSRRCNDQCTGIEYLGKVVHR
jgi:hypothetical protein